MSANIDHQVVDDFGDEWQRFDQDGVEETELQRIFEEYFSVFPWKSLSPDAEGFDLGCGSGRWAYFAARRVGKLHCIDPAAPALDVARRKLSGLKNCEFHLAGAHELPLTESSMDFGYSLGVLHHVPDTQQAMASGVRVLKRGAPFLVYLYYAFDQRPAWFKALWRASDLLRRCISVLPRSLKTAVTTLIAYTIYLPLSRTAHVLEKLGLRVDGFPLASYRDKSLYTLRTDARDRFGTRLEQRFTREQIHQMMKQCGLERIEFREGSPYWCAVGYRK